MAGAPAGRSDPPDQPVARDATRLTSLKVVGLDLASVDGQWRLVIRMDAGARAVCGDRLATVHLNADARTRECRTRVLAANR